MVNKSNKDNHPILNLLLGHDGSMDYDGMKRVIETNFHIHICLSDFELLKLNICIIILTQIQEQGLFQCCSDCWLLVKGCQN